MNQKKSIVLTTTFVGLVCGFVLTQQQAAAAATNVPDPTATSMVIPQNTATATSTKSAESTQKEQPVNEQNSTQKAFTNTDNVSDTAKQNQTAGTQTPATNTSTQTATSNNNTTTSALTQQAAASSASKANETTQPVSQPTAPTAPQATKTTNSANTASTTTDPQVETIAQGTWGTSKWEYTHQGTDYILHFHAGTLGASSQKTITDPNGYHQYFLGSIGASPEVFNGNWQWNEELTQIIIDPGVIANQDSSYLFGHLKNLKKIVGLANLDTTNVTNMSYMFNSCQNLTSLDLSNFHTTNVTDMSGMFGDCYNLTNLNLSHFNTTNVIDMSWMFECCQSLTSLDLSNFNTANVTDMSRMFGACQSLTSLDLSNFNTTKVTSMAEMFEDCFKFTHLDLSNFNTANVTDMSNMFWGCQSLTSLDLSNFNTTKVTDMFCMFRDCLSLNNVNVNNFKFNNTNLSGMFQECHALTSLDLSKWDTTSLDENQFWAVFLGAIHLHHLVLGTKTVIGTNHANLQGVPNVGTRVPGTDRVVTSPYWVATSGYQQGHKYTSNDLMELTGRDQVTTYDWDSKPAFTQTTETKTKVRTINLHQPNGQLKTETQTVAVSRPVTINPDGSKTYGAWTTAQWDQYTVPEWAGYQASQKQVPATTVSGDSANTTIDIYYQPLLQNVEIQYLDQGKVVGTQIITGYTGQTLMPNYQAPQGYEIVAAAPATITIDATGHQIIQVQVAH
ncbi:putative surface protein, partial (plasmid) [Bombilactobacillus mellifer]